MLSYLGDTLRDERNSRGVILAEIVATLKQRGVNIKSDGPLSRFERNETTPRNLDAVVQAYADVLNVDWHDLWKEAFRRSMLNNGEKP